MNVSSLNNEQTKKKIKIKINLKPNLSFNSILMSFHLKLLTSGQRSVVLAIYFTAHGFKIQSELTAIQKKMPALYFLPPEWKVSIQGRTFAQHSPVLNVHSLV
jgi:hypothetical protein